VQSLLPETAAKIETEQENSVDFWFMVVERIKMEDQTVGTVAQGGTGNNQSYPPYGLK
jgi:hypothetical protein